MKFLQCEKWDCQQGNHNILLSKACDFELPVMESGVPDFDISSMLGVNAPAATPKAAIDRLSAEIMRAVRLPEVKARLTLYGYEGGPFNAGEYDAYNRAKIQEIKKIASEAKIKVD